MSHLYKKTDADSSYARKYWSGTLDEYKHALATSTTVYVGNLSFYTREEQIWELFSKVGEVKRIIMGLNKYELVPCGFCFVEYFTHDATADCVNYISGSKLDDRIIRADWDTGFVEGRQFGRGSSGGQVRDEFREYYDPDRGDRSAAYKAISNQQNQQISINQSNQNLPTSNRTVTIQSHTSSRQSSNTNETQSHSSSSKSPPHHHSKQGSRNEYESFDSFRDSHPPTQQSNPYLSQDDRYRSNMPNYSSHDGDNRMDSSRFGDGTHPSSSEWGGKGRNRERDYIPHQGSGRSRRDGIGSQYSSSYNRGGPVDERGHKRKREDDYHHQYKHGDSYQGSTFHPVSATATPMVDEFGRDIPASKRQKTEY